LDIIGGGVDWIDLAKTAARFGHGAERSGCIKFGEFLDELMKY
jgi:hypothetical protein